MFALANPDPEVDPDEAAQHAAVVATGRSDYPNQINNVLAFPGVFRGLLDAQSRTVSDDMLVAAARALAGVVSAAELGPHYIIPSVFNPNVSSAVAAAVRDAAGWPAGPALSRRPGAGPEPRPEPLSRGRPLPGGPRGHVSNWHELACGDAEA